MIFRQILRICETLRITELERKKIAELEEENITKLEAKETYGQNLL